MRILALVDLDNLINFWCKTDQVGGQGLPLFDPGGARRAWLRADPTPDLPDPTGEPSADGLRGLVVLCSGNTNTLQGLRSACSPPISRGWLFRLARSIAETFHPGATWGLELALRPTVPQAADLALLDGVENAGCESHAGDFHELLLFSGDHGLAGQAMARLGPGWTGGRRPLAAKSRGHFSPGIWQFRPQRSGDGFHRNAPTPVPRYFRPHPPSAMTWSRIATTTAEAEWMRGRSLDAAPTTSLEHLGETLDRLPSLYTQLGTTLCSFRGTRRVVDGCAVIGPVLPDEGAAVHGAVCESAGVITLGSAEASPVGAGVVLVQPAGALAATRLPVCLLTRGSPIPVRLVPGPVAPGARKTRSRAPFAQARVRDLDALADLPPQKPLAAPVLVELMVTEALIVGTVLDCRPHVAVDVRGDKRQWWCREQVGGLRAESSHRCAVRLAHHARATFRVRARAWRIDTTGSPEIVFAAAAFEDETHRLYLRVDRALPAGWISALPLTDGSPLLLLTRRPTPAGPIRTRAIQSCDFPLLARLFGPLQHEERLALCRFPLAVEDLS